MDSKNYGLVIANHSHLHQEIGSHAIGDALKVLMPQGHGWGNYMPIPEQQQQNGLETFCCTCASQTSAEDFLRNFQFGLTDRTSFRLPSNYANIVQGVGTTIEEADNARMNHGWVLEKEFGFTQDIDAWSKFYSGVPNNVRNNAKANNQNISINTHYFQVNPDNLKNALQYSPVTVTGFAWSHDNSGIFHDYGNNPNHRFIIFDYVDGQCWRVFDSYSATYDQADQLASDYVKELAWDFNFGNTGAYYVIPATPQTNLLNKLKRMLEKIYMDIHGAKWFVKQVIQPDGSKFTGKQQISDIDSLAGALIDELGIDPKHNMQTDEQMSAFLPHKFFGK